MTTRSSISQNDISTSAAFEELKTFPNWVVWKLAKRQGKLTKVPFNPYTNEGADSTDPTSWASYERAIETFTHSKGKYAGIGFCFSHSPFFGFDADHCVDERGAIDAWAQELIDLINSYGELSPSETGVHVFGRGEMPEVIDKKTGESKHPGMKRGVKGQRDLSASVELYSEGRFFTWTGKHLEGTPGTINDAQEALIEIHQRFTDPPKKEKPSQPRRAQGQMFLNDEQIIEKAISARNGEDFKRLWNGDYSGYVSQSEADQALCNHLAFWCGKDAAMMERLFSRSGLYRPEKWERNARAGETYGQGTIARAIDSCTETYTGYAPLHTQSEATNGSANGQGLPAIIIGKQLREETQEALNALVRKERDNPILFLQQGEIKRVGRDERKRPRITDVGESELRNALTDAADFFRYKANSDEIIAISPPRDIVQAIPGLSAEKLPFPPLETIIQTPVLRNDGTILDQKGYDRATALYYMPQHGLHIPAIPAMPTQEDARSAMEYLKGFIQDFPFEGMADHANALGTALTTVTRPMFRHVPLGLIDATKQGVGKGLLTDFFTILLTGQGATALSPGRNDEELDKTLTALLMEGETAIVIDNVEGVLRSPVLAKILTSEYHKGRVLGVSRTVAVPQKAMWLANGNNLQVGGDMARRAYRMRMITQVSNPDAREGFRYPNLVKTVLSERGAIIAALLTIARAWFAAGQPAPAKKLRKVGTFTQWSETIGGMLAYAGVEGFLENVDILRKEADVDGNAWQFFYETWLAVLGEKTYKTPEIIEKLNAHKDFAAALPDPLGTLYLKEDKSFSRKLGRTLAKQNGTPYGPQNLRIVKGEDSHTGTATFKVAGYTPQNGKGLSSNAGYAGYQPLSTPEKISASNNIVDDIHTDNNVGMSEKTTQHTPHTPQGELEIVDDDSQYPANSDEDPNKRLADILFPRFLKCMEGKDVAIWKVADGVYPKGEISAAEYIKRIKGCIAAGDESLDLAIVEMRRKIGMSA